MTYQINTENTGLATDDQAREVARILAAAGHDVAFTRTLGLVNPSESCPCSDAEWEAALIAADAAIPAFGVGDRVEAGEGDDHDTGRIESVDGDVAFVAWDSGVKTPADLKSLRAA